MLLRKAKICDFCDLFRFLEATGSLVQHLNIFGLHFHGNSEETRNFNKQAFDAGASQFLQTAFISVQRTTHDAHLFANHGESQFIGQIKMGGGNLKSSQHG